MVKTLLIFLVIGVAAFFVFQQMKTKASPEEQKVIAIEDLYKSAVGKIMGAGGGPGVSGFDVTENAAAQIKRLRNDLAYLRGTLTDQKAIRRASDLEYQMAEFCRKNDIN